MLWGLRPMAYVKMAAVTVLFLGGGPALVLYLQPTPEELFERYSPEMKRRHLEQRPRHLKEYQEFLDELKEFSKSDRPIWVLQEEAAKKKKKEALRQERRKLRQEAKRRATMLQEQLEGQ
ncbi:hypothetical protein ABW21_db0208081 [Orbilia brochopaga]|nr:hypothetical protein ABW21_db0208081 [Drechslerella brochopaga]